MKIINTNKIDIPEYMEEGFFVRTLEDGLHEIQITVHEVNFEWGSNPGDNYCSRIYRVLVTYERFRGDEPREREQLSLIIKTIPIAPETQFLQDVGVFVKEKLTYTDVLPRLEILLDDEKFSASCFHAVKTPLQTIIFNDLTVQGFKLASRQELLDWNHCELLLKQLGKFHATSMVLLKRDSAIRERFKSGMLSSETILKSDTFDLMFGKSLGQIAQISATWPGFKSISEKLTFYRNNFKTITLKLASPQANDRFTVLNHGDLWTTNFMYSYDNPNTPKKPTKIIFIDFQLSFEGSPACDINFFLNTSVQLDVLKNRRDELIDVYYKSLKETLEFLRYDNIPTIGDLKAELRNRELYGLFALFGFLPIVTMPKDLSKDNSIEAISDEETYSKRMEKVFANETLLKYLKYGLKRFDDLGVLNDF